MSKYNSYAQRLDIAFKAARDEYAAAYNAVEQARKAMQDAGPDALKRQIATLQLQEAENSLRKEAARIWTEFDAKAADLRRALEKEVQTSNLADPSAIDGNAVELMKPDHAKADRSLCKGSSRQRRRPERQGCFNRSRAGLCQRRGTDLESVGQYDDRRQLLQRARRQRQPAHYSRRNAQHGRMVGAAFRRDRRELLRRAYMGLMICGAVTFAVGAFFGAIMVSVGIQLEKRR